MEALLISEKTLKQYTLINNNMDGVYLLPAIRMAQEIDLDTIIGPALNKKLQALVADNSISDESNSKYKLLLDEYVTPYLCFAVMSAVQININYKLTNSGTIQNDDERRSHLGYQENKNLQAQYDKYTNAYAMKLKNFLCAHSNDYPEYNQVLNYEGEEDPMLCSIYLNNRTQKYNYIGK